MKRKAKPLIVLGGLATVALVVWVLVPGPFSHGVIVGLFVGLGSIIGGFTVFIRIMKKRLAGRLEGRAIPATFVLDKTGMIAMRHFGAADWDADGVVAFVRGLAAKPST